MIRRISQASLRLLAAAVFLLFLPNPLAGATGEAYFTITPCRAVDTRNPAGPLGGPALGANETRIFTLAGTCGVPANALGLAVNLAVVAPAGSGNAKLYAGDAAAPPASVLNFSAGHTRANNTEVALASDGSGTVALTNDSAGPADFVIDVSGYFLPACISSIAVTNPLTATGTINAPFSQTFTSSGGTGTKTYSTASTLPPGLTLAANGTLSGTPTHHGTFPITVTATDQNGCTGTGPTYTLVIACQTITVTNPTVTTGTANAFFSQTFTQTGGAGATTFSTVSPLPNGMTLAANGLLSGTPTQAGGFPIVVTATDADGCTGSSTYNLVIACQTITVTNPAVAGGTAGQPFSQTFTQTGAIGTVTWSKTGALPTGITLSPAGVLSGTPTQTGPFSIVVKVTDGNLCTGTGAAYSLAIACQTITVMNPATTNGTVNTPFSQTFTQTGAIGAVTWSKTGALPAGITLSPAGVLSGTTTQKGSFPIAVAATDSNGCIGTSSYTLVIDCQSFSVGPTALPQGTTGVAYPTVTFTQTGGIGSATFSETGTLPNGMNFTVDTLSGTPTQIGTFPITVTATDQNGCTASRNYLLVVVCSGTSITLAPSSLPTVVAGSAFPTTQFTASGGTSPYTFTKAGALPTGMNFSVDTLSGTPTQTGTFPITISATDLEGCAGSRDYVITVTCNGVTITVGPPTLPSVQAGTAFGPVIFTGSGGTAPYTFAEAGGLPNGMTFSAGTLSGTPTQGGTFPITITATDANGCTGATAYSLVVTCQTITVTPGSLPNGIVGAAYNQTVTASGSTALPFTYSVTAGSLPTNLLLNASSGVISGTPTAAGAFTFTITATDANGCTGSTAYTVEICLTPTITPVPAAVCASTAGNQASGPAGAATYAWTIGNGTITSAANIQTITYTAGASGTVTLNLTTTTATGCSASTSAGVTINANPATPTITAPGSVCAGSTGNTASGPAGATTYAWTISNGTITSASNIQTITYTAGASGSVTLNLTVTNASGCSASNSATVAINPSPASPTITPTPATVCANAAGNTASGPVGATTYAWTIGNGTITSAANIQTITYTAGPSGSVTLNLTVTNGSGCSASNSTNITINANPIPTITPVPAAVCASSTGNQASGPLGATSYAWSISGGTITSANNIQTITYTAGASGSVTLNLTVTNASGCSASNSALVTINPNPTTPEILTSNPQTFTVTGGAGSFTLTFNGQTTSSLAFNATAGQVQAALNLLSSIGGVGGSVAVSLSAGVYTVAFGGSLGGPQPLLTALVAGGCTVVVSPPSVCADTTGNLATGPAGATTYAWTISGGTITSASNIQTITYTAGPSGNVTLNLTVTNASGCSASNSAIVAINPSPATPAITAPSSVCESSTLNTASGPAGATTYAWTISNGTITSASNIQNITFTAGASGTTLVLNLTVTNASGCSASNSTNITVNANPIPTITPVPAAVCASSTGNQASGPLGATTYAWTIGNGTITSANNIQTITYTAGASGNVTLNLTVTNASGCSASNSALVTINPNPTTPEILTSNPQTFTVTGASGTFTLTFNGQTTGSLAFNATAGQVQAALNLLSSISGVGGTVAVSLSAGVYTVAFGGNLTGPQPMLTALGAGGCSVVVSPPSVCADTTGNLATGPAGATTYAWTISGGTITSAANIQTITYTAGSSGTVTLNLTVTNASGCSANDSAIVTINPSPATPAITAPSSVCELSTGNAASGPAGATTYAWTISNGTITSASNVQNITFTAGASGTPVVLGLTVTNASGCSASNSTNITVNPSPATPTITPTPATVCANVAGNTASGPVGATTYAWTISNGTITSASNIQTITYTAGPSGSVTLNLTVTNGSGCSASNSATVTINPNPTLTPAPGALNGLFGQSFTQNFTAAPAGPTYTYSISPGTPPFGLSFSTSSGALTGTPNNTGLNVAFSITATNTATGCFVTQAYTLTVRPNAVLETFNNAVGNTQLVVTGSCPSAATTPNVCQVGSVLGNDSGPAVLSAGSGVIATTGSGSVAMSANGTFTYTPAVGFTGADTFTYTLTDGNGVTNTAVDTINVASRVWYVNGSAAGDGRSQNPFNLAAASTAHFAGDVIFVESTVSPTTTPGAITLKANVVLWGQGTSLPTINGSTILNTSATGKPSLTGTVTVGGAGVTISSLDIATAASTGLSASGALGTLTIQNAVTVTTTSGTAALFSSATGTVNANTTSLTAASGTAFSADLGTANFNWGGTIASATGRSISVTNRTGGTAAFSGAVSGNGTGILLNNNGGSTNTFTGGITLSTGSNAAFTATGGGTVSATQNNTSIVNTLTTTTGAALNVTNTTIGGAGLTFRSITSTGGSTPGILLDNTGSSGVFAVSGNGGSCTSAGTCTGGSISGKTGSFESTGTPGVRLRNNVANFRLTRMNISGNNHSGIYGGTVAAGGVIGSDTINGFQLDNCFISGNGDQVVSNPDEAGVDLYNLIGTAIGGSNPTSINNTTIQNNKEVELLITNVTGTLTDFQMTSNAISSNNNDTLNPHGDLVSFLNRGGAGVSMTLNVTGGSFTGFTGNDNPNQLGTTANGIFADTSGGSMTANVSGATFDHNNVGVGVSTAGTGSLTFDVHDNGAITQSRSHALNLFVASDTTGTVNGKFRNNVIGTNGVASSGSDVGFGIRVQNEALSTINPVNVVISGNTVQEFKSTSAINVNHGLNTNPSSKPTNVTITGNTIRNISSGVGTGNLRAIIIQENNTTAPGTVCADISGNVLTNIEGNTGDGTRIRLRQLAGGTVNVHQTDVNNLAAVNGSTAAQMSLSGTITFNQPACPQPP